MGGAMGWRPEHVRSAGLAEFFASFEGWHLANGGDSGPDFSAEALARLDAIVEEERVNEWRRKLRAMK